MKQRSIEKYAHERKKERRKIKQRSKKKYGLERKKNEEKYMWKVKKNMIMADRQIEREIILSPSIVAFVFVSFFAHLSVACVIRTTNRYIKVINESYSDLKCLA